ncbi:hypothetical protein M758_UG071700 [Ceratodon purpureus]|nr:hypothetical protein M758_UG071700 [Ceratodon purpureus]
MSSQKPRFGTRSGGSRLQRRTGTHGGGKVRSWSARVLCREWKGAMKDSGPQGTGRHRLHPAHPEGRNPNVLDSIHSRIEETCRILTKTCDVAYMCIIAS